MTIFYRNRVLGLGVDLLTALALTGVGVVFHSIAQKGSPLTLAEFVVLGVGVATILIAYNWLFNRTGSNSSRVRSAACFSTSANRLTDGAVRGQSTKNYGSTVTAPLTGRQTVA
jgi:hypothetical protein